MQQIDMTSVLLQLNRGNYAKLSNHSTDRLNGITEDCFTLLYNYDFYGSNAMRGAGESYQEFKTRIKADILKALTENPRALAKVISNLSEIADSYDDHIKINNLVMRIEENI